MATTKAYDISRNLITGAETFGSVSIEKEITEKMIRAARSDAAGFESIRLLRTLSIPQVLLQGRHKKGRSTGAVF